MRYLGIDFGSKRIGLALSDEMGMMAFPHSVISNNAGTFDAIQKICEEEQVGRVVIGESKDFKGGRNKIMDDIDVFVLLWKEQAHIPIFLEPEFLTSHQAQKIQGVNDMLDASAATLILQSFLDKQP